MLDNLFEYYWKNSTFQGTIIRGNGIKNWIFYASMIAYIVVSLVIVLFLGNYRFFALIPAMAIVLIFIGKIINASTIKRLDGFSKYQKNWHSWDTTKMNEYYQDNLSEYLAKIFGVKQFRDIESQTIDYLQNMIKERATKEKAHFITMASSFAALFIPLWSTFIIEIFKIASGNINHILKMFVGFLILISVYCYTIPILLAFRHNILTKYYLWKRLNEMITELKLQAMFSPSPVISNKK